MTISDGGILVVMIFNVNTFNIANRPLDVSAIHSGNKPD